MKVSIKVSLVKIMYPENDELCASIISQVIAKTKAKTNDDTRAASSTVDITMNRDRNQIYALRQKMFGRYLPHSYPSNKTESRSASVISNPMSNVKGSNKVFELRKVMFGSNF